jgi:hypothetical protein
MRSAIANKFLIEQRGTGPEPARIEIEIPASPGQACVKTGAHSYAPAGSLAPLTWPVAFDRMW